MKIKKILALAVALTSVFAVAGCGSTGDSSSFKGINSKES